MGDERTADGNDKPSATRLARISCSFFDSWDPHTNGPTPLRTEQPITSGSGRWGSPPLVEGSSGGIAIAILWLRSHTSRVTRSAFTKTVSL